MTPPEPAQTSPRRPAADVDVLVVGAGITGIYQLYRAREAGFSALLLEAGDGVGGTWYWNRYPGARFDSESYTYAYLFSKELFEEWEWQEHFAEQPEIERYLNHVVDRFDLRRHMRFGARGHLGRPTTSGRAMDRGRRRHRNPGPLLRGGHRRPLGAVLPRRARAGGVRGRVVPHGAVAGDAGRLHRQTRRRHRHRIERGAGHPGHRREPPP
jgi:glycine/D-amino acid oxidase-like deaminating enzyme